MTDTAAPAPATGPRPDVQDLWVDTPRGVLFARQWDPPAGEAAQHAAAAAPILLFHDSLGCVAVWRDFPERLCMATGRTVLAYDRLGFGRSAPCSDPVDRGFVATEADDNVPRLLAHCGFGRCVALGHSVGGGMATYTAARLGPACEALVTLSAQCFVEQHTLDGIRAAELAFAEPAEMDRLRKYHGDQAPWVLQAWARTWPSPVFADYSLEPALAQVRCPVLVIHGADDEYGTPRHAERIAAGAGGPAELVLLPGCRHVPHREQPDAVLSRIAGFLGGTPV